MTVDFPLREKHNHFYLNFLVKFFRYSRMEIFDLINAIDLKFSLIQVEW